MIRDKKTVQRYVEHHSGLLAMIENLREFVETMPVPDENEEMPNVDYGYTGDVGRIFEALRSASDVADKISDPKPTRVSGHTRLKMKMRNH